MSKIVTPPPNAVYEEWNESTAPVEVSVVLAPNTADIGTPKRTSLPSIAAPAACSAGPWCATSAATAAPTAPAHSTTMTATMA